ncbi:MAG: hypothetical protein LBR35_02270 [Rickettsiales bacterium]|nr:hypothetical protein [Rickettsiales bacterium]
MKQELNLPTLPKEVATLLKDGNIYILFLSDAIWKLNTGIDKDNGVWMLSPSQYEKAKLILNEDVSSSQFLIIASSPSINASANVFFNDGKLTFSPFFNVEYELKENSLKLLPTAYDDKNLTYHTVIEGEPDFLKPTKNKMTFSLPSNKDDLKDFVLTITAVFEDKTSTSFPLKIFLKSKDKLKSLLNLIYDFQLSEDKNKFLENVVIKGLSNNACFSKGIRKDNGDWIIKVSDLKDIEITSADSQNPITVELEYSYLNNGKIEKHTKSYKINLVKENAVFNGSKCINCDNKKNCALLDVLKYEYPYSPYLKYVE